MLVPPLAAVNTYVPLIGTGLTCIFFVPTNETAMVTETRKAPYIDPMPFSVDSLVTDDGWVPMSLKGQQESPTYYWEDGGLLKDAPVDFDATFAENMFVSTKPIEFMTFYRNPLKVVPNFTVPRHLHNIDETIIVFKGEYKIEFGDPDKGEFVTVKPGCFFTSRAGTPYTMTAGPEGVTYIETWGVPVTKLKTVWYDHGWVRKPGA
jgi:mannose-6-phosphate isomerase-like protein (cupin superfamily)